jgi:hypothetical protein
MPCVPELFHKPAGRESSAIISIDVEARHIHLDNASRCSFQGVEADVVNSASVGIPNVEGANVVYIAATNRVVSAVVVVEREEGGKTMQRPVYYLSEVLSTSKQNYPHYQKMTYGVYMAAKKLKHYFQEHPIGVVAEAPISEIISNKDASGQIAKWVIELSPYTPQCDKRDTIKT